MIFKKNWSLSGPHQPKNVIIPTWDYKHANPILKIDALYERRKNDSLWIFPPLHNNKPENAREISKLVASSKVAINSPFHKIRFEKKMFQLWIFPPLANQPEKARENSKVTNNPIELWIFPPLENKDEKSARKFKFKNGWQQKGDNWLLILNNILIVSRWKPLLTNDPVIKIFCSTSRFWSCFVPSTHFHVNI